MVFNDLIFRQPVKAAAYALLLFSVTPSIAQNTTSIQPSVQFLLLGDDPSVSSPASFTIPGTYTFNVPAGVTEFNLEVAGGSGGGGGSGNDLLYNIGGDGGNGSLTNLLINPAGATFTIVVGAHGSGGGSSTGSGASGGDAGAGYHDGGSGGTTTGYGGAGGGGGGSSSVTNGAQIIVASGGGGGGGGAGTSNFGANMQSGQGGGGGAGETEDGASVSNSKIGGTGGSITGGDGGNAGEYRNYPTTVRTWATPGFEGGTGLGATGGSGAVDNSTSGQPGADGWVIVTW